MESVRSSLVEMARSLLTGPLALDETIESAPVDTYLTGILWPRGAAVDGADDESGLESSGDDEASEAAVPGYRAIRPCSIGITFAVRAGATVTIDLGCTSRYEPLDVPGEVSAGEGAKVPGSDGDVAKGGAGSDARIRKVWVRRPLRYSVVLPNETESSTTRISTFSMPDGGEVKDPRLSLHIRRRAGPEQQVFTVTLINEETDSGNAAPRDARCLFQTEIVVRAELSGAPAIQPRPLPPADRGDLDALTNALLYRDVREFAVGHGIAATWQQDPGPALGEVRTAWLPESSVRGTSTDGHPLLADFRASWPDALRATFLAKESGRETVIEALESFASCYGLWIDQTLRERVEQFEGDLRDAAEGNLARCLSTCERIRRGVGVLRDDDAAWVAFALANAAMDRQALFAAKGTSARALVWRPFQLAFMLLVIPGLVDPSLEDRECMDLLWFPTGGGKTEAYLALTAFQIFHRRLQSPGRREQGGVDVLMRYTLRLLTVQQFQRAAALITACDLIRAVDTRLGSSRITLGLYVGGDATPNKMELAREAIAQEVNNLKPKSTPRQLLRCPVCGSDLRASSYRADPQLARIDIVCENPNCEAAGVSLPVMTVDAVIYETPPSLLIGTIDKFAQIPRSTEIRKLFGLDGGEPPGLIIQDELHLISGPLGSMAGLYETIVDTLCTRGEIRPKVIGSTATIGHAEQQVRSLFDREVLQFPPPGFEASDSFFAVRDSVGPDRLYVGIPTAGRSPKFALQAVVASLLQSAEALVGAGRADDDAIDPYWTCVAYFNSLRELGGAYVLMQDDVPRQMQFLAGRLGVSRRELQNLPVELSSRRSSRELPELLQALGATLGRFNEDPGEHPEPRDTVLASNMISVGVDVPRLGLMVVNGQPKSTAEYIQASSRVGRGIPGLVMTLYNFGRPRDLSHFEHFRSYHGALYRSVEATSVTPWAPRARDKALHAVIASLVRHLVPGLSDDDGAARFDPNDPAVGSILSIIGRRVAAATDPGEASDTIEDLRAEVEEWARRANEARATSGRLRYWIKKAPFGRTLPHLMCSAEEASPGARQAWPTPNTMREVEPSSAFILKTIPRKPRST
ncbi:helicase [Ramlibacter sp. USB13]|uniref:Helicase n=2 Tax=Ramlibacter cellulosilyticus TaxID=2764187 RepID=A0A923SE71_9BURK|nr:helicase [Ramlibacter cellulosilyticus]